MNTSQRPERTPFSLKDTLLIAGFTGIGYAIVALFTSGTLRYYGLPPGIAKPDLLTIFTTLGAMFNVLFVYHPEFERYQAVDILLTLPVLALIFNRFPVIGIRNRILRKYPLVVALPPVLSFLFTPVILAPWDLVFFVFGGCALWYLIRSHVEKGALVWQPIADEGADPSTTFWADYLTPYVDVVTMRIFLVALTLMPIAYYLGYENPSRSDDISIALLKDQNDRVAPYRPSEFGGDGTIVVLLRKLGNNELMYTQSVGIVKLPLGRATTFAGCRVEGGPPVVPAMLPRLTYPDRPDFRAFHFARSPDCASVLN